MEALNYVEILTEYGADIAFLSVLTCVCVEVLKKTLLKNCTKKVITFLPFLLGVFFYAVFAAATNLDFGYVIRELPHVCERGFTIGSLSTVVYVAYEQFVREKQK